MKKSNNVYLRQIIDYIEETEKYVDKVSFNGFESNGMLQDAVIRKVELIGEAARRLSPLFWEKYKKVLPLANAVSTRNKLIHEYDDIDLKIIWDTVKNDLTKLKKKIEEII